jgi:hypothetical protein
MKNKLPSIGVYKKQHNPPESACCMLDLRLCLHLTVNAKNIA